MKRVICLAVLALFATMLTSPIAAEAATLGPGYQYRGQSGSHLGGYLNPDGTISYCINAGAPSTIGKVTTDAGIVDSINGLDAVAMAQLNEVLSAHGNTSNNNTAAAVAMAVWSIADAPGYNAEGGDRYVLGRAPLSQRVVIRELAADYRAEAAAYLVPVGSANLTLRVESTNTAIGSLGVETTAAGTVTLTNGLFADNKKTTHPAAHGDLLDIIGVPTDTGPYRITAEGTFTGAAAPLPNVRLFTTPGSQMLSASGTATPVTFSASAHDTADRLVPGVSTSAQKIGTVGGTVVDSATATNVPSSGEQLSWNGFLQPSDATEPVCTEKTLVFSSSTPQTIRADGQYPSEPFPVRLEQVGRIFWVVTASVRDTVVFRGTCGDPEEVSLLVPAVHLPVVSG